MTDNVTFKSSTLADWAKAGATDYARSTDLFEEYKAFMAPLGGGSIIKKIKLIADHYDKHSEFYKDPAHLLLLEETVKNFIGTGIPRPL